MNYIKLNNILGLTDEEINNSKIELNMQAGVGGESYIDLWLYCDEKDKENGTCPECGYWGWYGNQRNFRPGQWVFSFVRLRDNEWLFTSPKLYVCALIPALQHGPPLDLLTPP